jgi:arachidonate 15-lipoxygenase (second type)/8-lipoxygenase (S-type)
MPFSLVRLSPKELLPFVVDSGIAERLSGMSLSSLHQAGRLFYVDYSSQANLTLIEGRYAAASQAYFYIDPKSGDFLPLALKPHPRSDLVYTPLDTANDWLLAKMLFNQNELWFTSWYHLTSTHMVAELVYMAAIRCLSDEHPILALLDRCKHSASGFCTEINTDFSSNVPGFLIPPICAG